MVHRLSTKSSGEMDRTNAQLHAAISQAQGIATRMEALSRRPKWEPFALALLCAFIMATVVAGILFVTLPDYGQITKNQVAIYHAIEAMKGGKVKAQAGK